MVGTGYVCNIARLGVGVKKKTLCEVVDFLLMSRKGGFFLHEQGVV